MKFIHNPILSCILFLVITIINNSIFANASPDLVNNVLDKAGIYNSFDSYDATIKNVSKNMLATNSNLSQAQKDELSYIFLNSLNSIKILDAIFNQVSVSMHDDELKSILDVYELDIMKKVQSLEQNLSSEEVVNQMHDFANNIGKNPPAKIRLELVERLDNAGKFSAKTSGLLKNIFKVLFEGFNALDKKIDDDKLKQSMDSIFTMLDYATKQQFQMGFLFTYRDLSDDELIQYIEILETDNNIQAFNNAVLEGTNKILERFARDMSAAMLSIDDKKVIV